MLFKTMLDVEELNKMKDVDIDYELSWAYTILFDQIKEAGSITKEMVIKNKKLLENNYELVGDVYNEALSDVLYNLPVDLLPNDVSEPAPTVAFIYGDCTIQFNINKDDGEYWLFLFDAESNEGHQIPNGHELQEKLEWHGEIDEVITEIREYFDEMRKENK